MGRTPQSDIILDIDGLNHLKAHPKESHNLDKAAIIKQLSPLAIEAGKKAAEEDFKAMMQARQAPQSDTNTGGN